MGSEHTAAHFRDELLLSPFFDALSWGVGNSLDKERIEKLAAAKAKEWIAAEPAPILTRDQECAIDEVVAEAWSKLAGGRMARR